MIFRIGGPGPRSGRSSSTSGVVTWTWFAAPLVTAPTPYSPTTALQKSLVPMAVADASSVATLGSSLHVTVTTTGIGEDAPTLVHDLRHLRRERRVRRADAAVVERLRGGALGAAGAAGVVGAGAGDAGTGSGGGRPPNPCGRREHSVGEGDGTADGGAASDMARPAAAERACSRGRTSTCAASAPRNADFRGDLRSRRSSLEWGSLGLADPRVECQCTMALLKTVRAKLTTLVGLSALATLAALPLLHWLMTRELVDVVDDRVPEAVKGFEVELVDDIGDLEAATKSLGDSDELQHALARQRSGGRGGGAQGLPRGVSGDRVRRVRVVGQGPLADWPARPRTPARLVRRHRRARQGRRRDARDRERGVLDHEERRPRIRHGAVGPERGRRRRVHERSTRSTSRTPARSWASSSPSRTATTRSAR